MAAKAFEVNEVLPATTQLRISWVNNILIITNDSMIYSNNGSLELVGREYFGNIIIADSDKTGNIKIHDFNMNSFSSPYTNYNGNHAYCDIDTSNWDINSRTISSISTGMDIFTWEDLAPAYSITFEENGGTTITDLTEQTALPTPLPTTTRLNHVFAGWYYDALFTQKANAGATIESNVTLYAKWYSVSGWFSDVADAIRTKDGTAETIEVVDFPDRIRALNIAVELTQTQYDALSTKDSNTYYLIVEEA